MLVLKLFTLFYAKSYTSNSMLENIYPHLVQIVKSKKGLKLGYKQFHGRKKIRIFAYINLK